MGINSKYEDVEVRCLQDPFENEHFWPFLILLPEEIVAYVREKCIFVVGETIMISAEELKLHEGKDLIIIDSYDLKEDDEMETAVTIARQIAFSYLGYGCRGQRYTIKQLFDDCEKVDALIRSWGIKI